MYQWPKNAGLRWPVHCQSRTKFATELLIAIQVGIGLSYIWLSNEVVPLHWGS